MPTGHYPHGPRPDKRTPNVCTQCGVELHGENWPRADWKKCRTCFNSYHNEKNTNRYKTNPEHRARMIAYATERNRALREEMLRAYGHRCACCGETDKEFLTLDHAKGRGHGAAHRKVVGDNLGVLRWLKANGWPTEGFRILCWNCNCATGMYGRCPHEKRLRLVPKDK